MKKIQTINLKQLRVEECFGFLKQVETETVNLSSQEETDSPSEISLLANVDSVLQANISAFKAAVDAFDIALKASSINPASAEVAATDTARDDSWRKINNYVKAMCGYPDDDVAASAIEARALFEKYGDPTSLAQTEKSGILHNLLQDLEGLDSAKREALTLDPWINNLRKKEEAYLAASNWRTEANSTRQVGIVKDSRVAAEVSYRTLVDTVNAYVVFNGAETYATFINHLNAIIDRQKAILKVRATNNSKRKDNEEKPEEQEPAE